MHLVNITTNILFECQLKSVAFHKQLPTTFRNLSYIFKGIQKNRRNASTFQFFFLNIFKKLFWRASQNTWRFRKFPKKIFKHFDNIYKCWKNHLKISEVFKESSIISTIFQKASRNAPPTFRVVSSEGKMSHNTYEQHSDYS